MDLSQGQTRVDAVQRGRACANCGLSHKPRECPAFGHSCRTCGKLNHWAKMCRSKGNPQRHQQTTQQAPQQRQQQGQRKFKPRKRRNKTVNAITSKEVEYSYDEYVEQFFAVTISEQCLHAVSKSRDEAYTVLGVRPPVLSGDRTLRLKIDTGAAGNMLPVRTFHQIFGKNSLHSELLTPTPGVKLVSYSGNQIKCHGRVTIPCRYRDSAWAKVQFYVIDVPGPAILGLRNSESLGIVTLNIDEVTPKQPKIDNLRDAMEAFLKQFDSMGDFEGEEHLLLSSRKWKTKESSEVSLSTLSGAQASLTAQRRTAA